MDNVKDKLKPITFQQLKKYETQLVEMIQQKDLHGIVEYMSNLDLSKELFNKLLWGCIQRINRNEHQMNFNKELNKLLKDK